MKALYASGFIGTITGMKYCIECNNPKSDKGEYCKSCSYKHRTRPSGLKYNIQSVNKGWMKQGQEPWNKGKKTGHTPWNKGLRGIHLSPNTEFTKDSVTGELNNNWKGDEVGYHAIHTWVERHKGRTGVCEDCGKEGWTHFANIDHEYRRRVEDYRELCPGCHHKFDGRYQND